MIIIEDTLRYASFILRSGGVVIIPTETFYGIAARYDCEEALSRIAEMKKRTNNKPFPLIAASKRQVREIATDDSYKRAERFIRFWPAPLSIVFDSKKRLSRFVAANDGIEVAIRITSLAITRSICRMVDAPICATSANLSGERPPAVTSCINDALIKAVDFVIDYGTLKGSEPSSIIRFNNGRWSFVRRGVFQIEGINDE